MPHPSTLCWQTSQPNYDCPSKARILESPKTWNSSLYQLSKSICWTGGPVPSPPEVENCFPHTEVIKVDVVLRLVWKWAAEQWTTYCGARELKRQTQWTGTLRIFIEILLDRQTRPACPKSSVQISWHAKIWFYKSWNLCFSRGHFPYAVHVPR